MTDRKPPRPDNRTDVVGRIPVVRRELERPRLPPPLHPRRDEPTQVGYPAPPAPGSAPLPSIDLDSTQGSPPPPRAYEVTQARRRPPPVTPASGGPPIPQAPPRSLSPAPVSVSSDGVRFRWTFLRKALPWVLPVLLTIGGSFSGYLVAAWYAAKQIAVLEAADEDKAKRLAKAERALKDLGARLDETDNAVAAEASSNRTERATIGRRVTKLEEQFQVKPETHNQPKP